MITAEIRVNAQLVGHIYCVNTGNHTNGWHKYRYEYYRPDGGIIKGEIEHFRDNGAIALVKEICEDVETKGGQ
jgi:hypothetical protein